MTVIMMEGYDAIRILSSSMFLGITSAKYEGWNFNSGKYLFTTDTK